MSIKISCLKNGLREAEEGLPELDPFSAPPEARPVCFRARREADARGVGEMRVVSILGSNASDMPEPRTRAWHRRCSVRGVIPTLRLRSTLAGITMAALGVIVSSAHAAEASSDAACLISDVEYDVRASVVVRDTLFGAANGVYPMGAGKLTLRVDGDAVRMMSYDLANRLTVPVRIAMLSMAVVTTSRTSTASDPCNGSATGTLHGDTLVWGSTVSGYRSDGTQSCTGSMCGRFGAPPAGARPFHDVPAAVTLNPFRFSPDGSTFTMPYMFVSRSTSPKQTTYLALAGRRVKMSCGASACSQGSRRQGP
jgi:hypothetical protein